jgi:hypothetical protein
LLIREGADTQLKTSKDDSTGFAQRGKRCGGRIKLQPSEAKPPSGSIDLPRCEGVKLKKQGNLKLKA